MADNKQPTPTTPRTADGDAPEATSEQTKKKKLTLEIDDVDTSEVLERKISA